MVYIRPSAPVILSTAIKPAGSSSSSPEDHSLASDSVVNEYRAKPEQDRRQQDDRRQQKRDALLETRAGKDRRKNRPSINIKV